MLIRITNRCHMNCSHCMIDASGPEGEHMTHDTFERALDLRARLEARITMLSGGEPTDHPDFFELATKALEAISDSLGVYILASNGLFVLDDQKYADMCELTQKGCGFLVVQITNDSRYYSRNLALVQERFDLPHWRFTDHLRQIMPCRRTHENNIEPSRVVPLCANLRANTRRHGLLRSVVALESVMRTCSPSVSVDGSVRAGEMDTCYKIGDVTDSVETLESNLVNMTCNACGLRDNLKPDLKEMLGEE